MKRNLLIAIGMGVMLALATGCSVYHPQAVDIPLINHRGETRVDISGSLSTAYLPDAVGINMTASHGVSDWIAVQGHANYGGDNAYGQIASGVYRPIGRNFVLEGYAGIGFGGAWHDGGTLRGESPDDSTTTRGSTYAVRGRYTLPFVQVNLGWRDLTSAHIGIAFGMKVGRFLPQIRYSEYDPAGYPIADREELYATPDMLFEPQLQFNIGTHRVKYNLRAGLAILPNLFENAGHAYNDILTISTGLTFNL